MDPGSGSTTLVAIYAVFFLGLDQVYSAGVREADSLYLMIAKKSL